MLERVARYGNDYVDEPRNVGVFGRMLGAVARNPVRAAAVLVIVIGAGAIVTNAVFFQTGEHPAPMFNTRDGAAATPEVAAAPAVTAPAAATDEVARLVELTAQPQPPAPTIPASALVVEVQQLLTQLGYQPGTVDGLIGSRTRAAIEAYQTANGMPVNTAVTEELVAALRATAAAAPTPVAAVAPPATAATGGQPSQTATVLAVQTALNQSGYGPITANGTMTGETVEAIRRFQLAEGLGVNGQFDDALVARMRAIGALQ